PEVARIESQYVADALERERLRLAGALHPCELAQQPFAWNGRPPREQQGADGILQHRQHQPTLRKLFVAHTRKARRVPQKSPDGASFRDRGGLAAARALGTGCTSGRRRAVPARVTADTAG